METIVFHSYKGGIGRTLTLSNLATVLGNAGLKVLVMDWDFNAPGLGFKFDVESNIKKGYVDYLVDCAEKAKSSYIDDLDGSIDDEYKNKAFNAVNSSIVRYRKNYLKDLIVEAKGPDENYKNVYLLPAGKSSKSNYWKLLASDDFHDYFEFETPLKNRRNKKFFLDEQKYLSKIIPNCVDVDKKETWEFDFLLIDSKTGSARAAVPLLVMADRVVELFNLNKEGVFGENLIYEAIKTKKPKLIINKKYFPVITRIPANTTQAMVKYQLQRNLDNISKICPSAGEREIENFEALYLHEHRDLEVAEKLILVDKSSDENINIPLAHDYLKLFKKVCPKNNVKIKEILETKNWHELLGLAKEIEVVEKYFSLHLVNGALINSDDDRNVSFRTETFKQILFSIVLDQKGLLHQRGLSKIDSNKLITRAIRKAGEKAGEDFGKDIINFMRIGNNKINDNLSISHRLEYWCEFDQRAGFGAWKFRYDEKTESGRIEISNYFLGKDDSHSDAEGLDNIGFEFIVGYVQSVLGYLIPLSLEPNDIGVTANIASAKAINIDFELV